MSELMLSPREVAERLTESLGVQIAEERVRAWCRGGKLPGARQVGRAWVVPESDVVAVERLKEHFSRDAIRNIHYLLPAPTTLGGMPR